MGALDRVAMSLLDHCHFDIDLMTPLDLSRNVGVAPLWESFTLQAIDGPAARVLSLAGVGERERVNRRIRANLEAILVPSTTPALTQPLARHLLCRVDPDS